MRVQHDYATAAAINPHTVMVPGIVREGIKALAAQASVPIANRSGCRTLREQRLTFSPNCASSSPSFEFARLHHRESEAKRGRTIGIQDPRHTSRFETETWQGSYRFDGYFGAGSQALVPRVTALEAICLGGGPNV